MIIDKNSSSACVYYQDDDPLGMQWNLILPERHWIPNTKTKRWYIFSLRLHLFFILYINAEGWKECTSWPVKENKTGKKMMKWYYSKNILVHISVVLDYVNSKYWMYSEVW